MQIKRIIPGQWYQTTKGIGKCCKISGSKVYVEIDRKKTWVSSSEVQHEMHKDYRPEDDEDQPQEVEKNRIKEIVENVKDNTNEARVDLAEATAKPGDHLPLMKAALHALRSYPYGNGSTLLAEEVADALEGFLNAK